MNVDQLAQVVRAIPLGGPHTFGQVRNVLQFFVAIEPNPNDLNGDRIFADRMKKHADAVEHGKAIVKQFGQSLPDFTTMQEVFYFYSNSDEFRATATSISVVRVMLSSCWDGVNGWRD